MNHKLLKILFFGLLIFGINKVSAQRFVATIDHNSVGLGDIVQVRYNLDGANGSSFSPPNFINFRIISGPNISSSINMNGNVTVSSSYSYVLQAIALGKSVIRPASIIVNGTRIFSNSIAVTVGKGAIRSQTQNKSSSNTQDVFLMASANKTNVVAGEAIAVTYKLYVGDNVRIAAPTITGMPTFTGFWVENGKDLKQINATRENYKGKSYEVYDIRKMILFPQKTGQLTVDPLEIECEGQMTVQKRRDPSDPFSDMFGDFFNMNAVPFHKDIKSDALKVDVTPLPEKDKPASFLGFVGKAALSVSATPQTVKTNEAITYNISIGGEGNLSLIQPLKLNLPAGIEVYDPKTIDKFDRNGDNLTGIRTFQYTLIPHYPGKFEIPSVAFSFYDPAARKYFEAKTGSISVNVEKNNSAPPASVSTPSKPNESSASFAKWGILLASTFILLSAVLLFAKRTVKLPHNTELKDDKTYQEISYNDHLNEAEKLVHLDENNEFYTFMLNALYAFVSQKFSRPFSELSHTSIRETLEQKSIPSELISTYLNIIAQCEMMNYAPSGFVADKGQILTEGKELIGKINNL